MPDPLERRARETTRANTALRDFAALGPGRRLRQLSERYQSIPKDDPMQPPTRSRQSLKAWCKRWDWIERVQAWDDAQNQLVSEQEQALWLDRMRELRETEWDQSQALIERAREMLEFPLAQVRQVEENDGQTKITIVMPAKWTLRDAAAYMEAASKLGRMAGGVETDRTQTRHADAEGYKLILGGNIDPDEF